LRLRHYCPLGRTRRLKDLSIRDKEETCGIRSFYLAVGQVQKVTEKNLGASFGLPTICNLSYNNARAACASKWNILHTKKLNYVLQAAHRDEIK